MKKLTGLIIVIYLLSGIVASATAQVLVFNRADDDFYVHDNIDASVAALQKICDQYKLTMDVSADPAVFTDDNLKQYKTIVFCNTNNKAFDTDEQRQAFQRYIRTGGGFFGLHSACTSEPDWPWFISMVGGLFLRHPVLQPFDVRIIDKNHQSTYFLPDPWAWEDECYYMHHLNPDIKVLLAADMTTVKDDQKDDYPGDTWGDLIPLAWYHEYDGGRQFFTALGHKIEHYKDPLFLRHLEAGLLWSINK